MVLAHIILLPGLFSNKPGLAFSRVPRDFEAFLKDFVVSIFSYYFALL